jgi:hypothetical protein
MHYGRHGGHLGFSLNIQIDVIVEPYDLSNLNLVDVFTPTRAIFSRFQILPKPDMAATAAVLDFRKIFKSM